MLEHKEHSSITPSEREDASSTSATSLARALDARRSGFTWTANCPVCHYPKALRIAEGNRERNGKTRLLVRCFSGGCSYRAIVGAAKEYGFQEGRGLDRFYQRASRRADGRRRAIRRFWGQCIPPEGTLAEHYLRVRGINGPVPGTLRYSSQAWHAETKRRFPCLVAAVTVWPSRVVRAVHRTFLAECGDGKARIEPSKKTWGPTSRGAVRLAPLTNQVVVAEGLESALSAMTLLGIPAWAALSAGNLERLVLPDEVREITIAADNDRPGLAAAYRAARRWRREGRSVGIVSPRDPGLDMNDVLLAQCSVEPQS